MDRRKPELLCPAGDMEKLRMAVAYGADAVYLAGTSFGMRSFTANFTPDELPQAISNKRTTFARVEYADLHSSSIAVRYTRTNATSQKTRD